MDHIAYMKKSWHFLDKILSGEKKIESRWYTSRRMPWKNIRAGETVYFKNSGAPVLLTANVSRALFFSDLTPQKVHELLKKYGKALGIERKMMLHFFKVFQYKKYCIFIFLENPRLIKPFEIDKTGFGAMAAWISVPNVNKIKIGYNRPMSTKCFNCQSVFDKKLEKGHSVLLSKYCPDCRKPAPRQSMRPMRSPKK